MLKSHLLHYSTSTATSFWRHFSEKSAQSERWWCIFARLHGISLNRLVDKEFCSSSYQNSSMLIHPVVTKIELEVLKKTNWVMIPTFQFYTTGYPVSTSTALKSADGLHSCFSCTAIKNVSSQLCCLRQALGFSFPYFENKLMKWRMATFISKCLKYWQSLLFSYQQFFQSWW